MPHALIGLGSNLGDRRQLLDLAMRRIIETSSVEQVHISTWHATQPVGGPSGQAEFLNGAALVRTSLAPEALLARLQEIESELGRQRSDRWGPRTIDLDLLLYDELVKHGSPLELPHPRMAFRRFVLAPAAEVAPQLRHPLIGWTIAELLHHLNTAIEYVAISGSLFDATHRLATATASKTGWNLLELPDAGDGSRPATSPSLTLPRAIQFLHEQADLLAIERWPVTAGGTIGSFWIEDLLAIGDVLWPGALQEVWKPLSATVVPPKLLVDYQTTLEQFEIANPLVGNSAMVWQRFSAARRRRTQRPGIGPVLRLNADDPLAAETELIAAIGAMN